MKNQHSILNQNAVLIIIGITLSWLVAEYWYNISNSLIGIFGTGDNGEISTQQILKKSLFTSVLFGLLFVAIKVFREERQHIILKLTIIISIMFWLGFIFIHLSAVGLVS
ncbi:hypothetical protein OAQ90_03265 [Schleiferiaceae bacterium]|nr:hypothetical protein [Schleiferiaceae bacterium]MDC3399861.1 hypothetical protein [Schleiferiaceae bacterium]